MKGMARRARPKVTSGVPVLKMPPDLALPAVRILHSEHSLDERVKGLRKLRPDIPERTLLNAYVLPSLVELKLYVGTLKSGRVTRYGEALAQAPERRAHGLMARHLAAVDAQRIGIVDWLAENFDRGEKRRTVLNRFIAEKLTPTDDERVAILDRLGKWAGYLIFFGILREKKGDGDCTWSVSKRNLDAIRRSGTEADGDRSSAGQRREALLEAYSKTSMRLGTRLYLPVSEFRDDLGRILRRDGILLPDGELDDIIREAPTLLPKYLVTFAPFSGPARGGLKLPQMYAGFISMRQRTKVGQ